LEIGGGTGNFKSFSPKVVSTDIQFASWLDVVCDAHTLPFKDSSYDNLVLFDVLHHLEQPKVFLDEAMRVLKPGGRLIMMEPAITPVSRVFYTYFHPEDVDTKDDPFCEKAMDPIRDPYDSNQALPTLIFDTHRSKFVSLFPDLKIVHAKYVSLFTYPLTGGFRSWTLIPAFLVRPGLYLETLLEPVLGALFAFRLFVVLERK